METSVRQEGASRKRDLGCAVCGAVVLGDPQSVVRSR